MNHRSGVSNSIVCTQKDLWCLGIDYSTRAVHIAALSTSDQSWLRILPIQKTDTAHDILDKVTEAIDGFLGSRPLVEVGIEKPWFGPNAYSAITLIRVATLIEAAVGSLGVTLSYIPNATWKKAVLGKGIGIKTKEAKAQTLAWAKEKGYVPDGSTDNNASDAYAIAWTLRERDRMRIS